MPLNTDMREAYLIPLGLGTLIESMCRTVKKDLVEFLGFATWTEYLACLGNERAAILPRFVWPEEEK